MHRNRLGRRAKYLVNFLLAILAIGTTVSCKQLPAEHSFGHGPSIVSAQSSVCQTAECTQERDEIYSLLAYAIVAKDWQSQENYGTPIERGHNIGSVLVDPTGQVVFWARNCNAITNDASQHGEVRLMRSYLANTPATKYLDGYTIYTTLEPCAMCSGMMALTKVKRAVYGQTDPSYGRAIERLMLDSRALRDSSDGRALGFKPYPRGFTSEIAATSVAATLDEQFARSGEATITKWLRSDVAHDLFKQATEDLLAYKPIHAENVVTARAAIALYKSVPDHYVEFDFHGFSANK
jgi:tRNA(Arg) A34 adenosine deaminase TadA